jgi:hypothetical protein
MHSECATGAPWLHGTNLVQVGYLATGCALSSCALGWQLGMSAKAVAAKGKKSAMACSLPNAVTAAGTLSVHRTVSAAHLCMLQPV